MGGFSYVLVDLRWGRRDSMSSKGGWPVPSTCGSRRLSRGSPGPQCTARAATNASSNVNDATVSSAKNPARGFTEVSNVVLGLRPAVHVERPGSCEPTLRRVKPTDHQ